MRHSLALAGLVLATAHAADAQARTYCLTGARFTCFALEVQTTANATSGTDAVVRVSNRQGSVISGVTNQVDWSRLYRIEFQVPRGHGGAVVSADPAVTVTGAADSIGGLKERWFASNVGDEGGIEGWAVATPYTEWGADIIGCGQPPNLRFPWVKTCGTDGPGTFEIRFSTDGRWNAGEAAVVVVFEDQYAADMACMISGSLFDDSDAYHCEDYTNGPPVAKQPATLALGDLSQIYSGSARTVSVTTTPANLTGVTVTYDGNATPPTNVGSYAVRATLTSDSHEAPAVTGTLIIAPAPQAIAFTSTPPSHPMQGDAAYLAAATGGASGNPIVFGGASPSVCGVTADGVVSFTGVGTCTITANQAGSAQYLAAPEVQQSFAVAERIASATTEISPQTISLGLTGTVSAYLYSTADFDATKTAPASVHLRIDGGNAVGAPVSSRGPTFTSAVGDYNGDGRLDRLFVFTRAGLQAAGLTTSRTAMVLEDVSGTLKFHAVDGTPPAIVP